MKLLLLANGMHVARWRDPLGGQQRQQNLTKLGLTTAEARQDWAEAKAKALADLRAGVAAGVVEARRVGLAAAVDSYLKRFGHAPTAKAKRYVLDALAIWLRDNRGCQDAADIKPVFLIGWRDHVLRPDAGGHEMSTRNRWLAASSAFLRWLQEQGHAPLLTGDAIRAGTKRAKQPDHGIEFLRPPQVKALLTAALAHDKAGHLPIAGFVLGLLCTGARFEELRGLRWRDVDLPAGELRFQAENVKTRQARTVTFKETPSMLALLNALSLRRGKRELVFDVEMHATWDRACKRLQSLYKAPAFTAHTLRRTCGTVLTNSPGIYAGASAWHSAKRLGHSVEMSEKLYAGLMRDLPVTATTLEAALGVEGEAAAIVAAAGGVVGQADAGSATAAV